jgi:hypothetical protein
MTRQVLIVDGPLRGQLREYDGRERFAVVRGKPYDPFNPPAYDEVVYEQIEYIVRPLVMFSRRMLVASVGQLGELDLIDLIITDTARKAIQP